MLLRQSLMNNTVKVERARNNMFQTDLAEKADVTRQTIYAIETKHFVPPTVLALKLAKGLKVEIIELFELEESDWE